MSDKRTAVQKLSTTAQLLVFTFVDTKNIEGPLGYREIILHIDFHSTDNREPAQDLR